MATERTSSTLESTTEHSASLGEVAQTESREKSQLATIEALTDIPYLSDEQKHAVLQEVQNDLTAVI